MTIKAIETRYFGPSKTRGPRIKAFDSYRNSVTIPYDPGLNSDDNHRAAAEALRKKMGWTGTMIMGGTSKWNVFVFADLHDPRDRKSEGGRDER